MEKQFENKVAYRINSLVVLLTAFGSREKESLFNFTLKPTYGYEKDLSCY
jgi:hypothetical protein